MRAAASPTPPPGAFVVDHTRDQPGRGGLVGRQALPDSTNSKARRSPITRAGRTFRRSRSRSRAAEAIEKCAERARAPGRSSRPDTRPACGRAVHGGDHRRVHARSADRRVDVVVACAPRAAAHRPPHQIASAPPAQKKRPSPVSTTRAPTRRRRSEARLRAGPSTAPVHRVRLLGPGEPHPATPSRFQSDRSVRQRVPLAHARSTSSARARRAPRRPARASPRARRGYARPRPAAPHPADAAEKRYGNQSCGAAAGAVVDLGHDVALDHRRRREHVRAIANVAPGDADLLERRQKLPARVEASDPARDRGAPVHDLAATSAFAGFAERRP